MKLKQGRLAEAQEDYQVVVSALLNPVFPNAICKHNLQTQKKDLYLL